MEGEEEIELKLGPCGHWVIFLTGEQTQALRSIAKLKKVKAETLLEQMIMEFVLRHSTSQLEKGA